jgi:hypothetical protein
MGNFEVSVAICWLLALFQIGYDMLQDCSKINNKASDRYVLFFEETIIRKQFHSLVV